MQRILATTFSRRRTFDAQCGLTAGLNCEAAHGTVWNPSDIGIYNYTPRKTATTATDNCSKVDYVCNVVVVHCISCHVVQCRHSILLTCIFKPARIRKSKRTIIMHKC